MPNATTRLRRMTAILDALVELNPNDGEENLRGRVMALRQRAAQVLADKPFSLMEARKKALKTNKRKGEITRGRVLPLIAALRLEGFTTYKAIAAELNKRRIYPPTANKWTKGMVHAIETRGADRKK